MELTVQELSQSFDVVISYFDKQNIKDISFPNDDYYPQVLREDLNFSNPNFLRCPQRVTGSLYDDLVIWKNTLNEGEDAVYGVSGVLISNFGGILRAFGQVSDKLDNPSPIRNVVPPGYPKEPPPKLTIHELQKIFNLVVRWLKMRHNSPDISFEDPRYIKIALKDEYLGMECPPYTIGSLDDCIKTWKEILNNKAEPSAFAIEQLGDLLIAFGEEIDK